MKFLLLVSIIAIALSQITYQSGVITNATDSASFIIYNITSVPKITCLPILKELARKTLLFKDYAVLALGPSLKEKCLDAESISIPNIRKYPDLKSFPYTGGDFFVHIKTKNQDERFDIAKAYTTGAILEQLFGTLTFTEVIGFSYRVGGNGLGRDLSGFEDGTENPQGVEERVKTAFTPEHTSILLTQKWVHNLKLWEKIPVDHQEKMIGRTKKDSRELHPLPEGSHVERTEENPMVRHSMPYGDSQNAGLFFVAYAADAHTYHHTLRRMGGAYDNIHDKIIGSLSVAVSGAYWWVPNIIHIRAWSN